MTDDQPPLHPELDSEVGQAIRLPSPLAGRRLSSADELHNFKARAGAEGSRVPIRLFHDAAVQLHGDPRWVDSQVA